MKLDNLIQQLNLPMTAKVQSQWIVGATPTQETLQQEYDNPCIFFTSHTIKHFSTIQRLILQLQEKAPILTQKLAQQYQSSLEVVVPQLFEQPSATDVFSEFFVIQGLIRSVSRNTIKTASCVDGTAQFLATLLQELSIKTLICCQAEQIDAASMLIINRLHTFAEGNGLSTLFYFNQNPLQPIKTQDKQLLTRFERARYKLFAAVANRLAPQLTIQHHTHQPITHDSNLGVAQLQTYNLCISEIVAAISYQTYDRAYIICQQGLQIAQNNNQRARIWRLIALIDSNLGEIELAKETLQKALSLAEDPLLQANLYYLQGLIFVKRIYNIKLATDSFQKGMETLDAYEANDNISNQNDVDVERAWLFTGFAFLESLHARQKGADVTHHLEQAHAYQSKALDLTENIHNDKSAFIRFNLFTNLAFLLEIMKNMDKAIESWHQAFLPHIENNADEESKKFQKMLKYRIGLLNYHAEQYQQATTLLQESAQAAEQEGDTFALSRILYSLAIIAQKAGEFEQAYEHFCLGVQVARLNHDWHSVREHLQGVRYLCYQTEHTEHIPHIHEKLELVCLLCDQLDAVEAGDSSWANRVNIQDISAFPPRPIPKLPIYNPVVDLAATPKIDLNRYLEAPNGIQNMYRLGQKK